MKKSKSGRTQNTPQNEEQPFFLLNLNHTGPIQGLVANGLTVCTTTLETAIGPIFNVHTAHNGLTTMSNEVAALFKGKGSVSGCVCVLLCLRWKERLEAISFGCAHLRHRSRSVTLLSAKRTWVSRG